MKFAIFASNDIFFTQPVINNFVQSLTANGFEYEIFTSLSKKSPFLLLLRKLILVGFRGFLYLFISNKNKIKPNHVDVNSSEFISYLINNNFNIGISIGFGELFKSNIINYFKGNLYNIHCSLLPRDKGFMPVFWALYHDRKFTGVTLHLVDSSIDTGNIIDRHLVHILPSDTYISLSNKLKYSCNLILDNHFKLKHTIKIESSNYNRFPKIGEILKFRSKRKFI